MKAILMNVSYVVFCTLGVVLTLFSSRAADSLIGVNFVGANAAGAPTLLGPSEEAGVVSQGQWNNFSDYSVTNYPLRDAAGNLTGITISYLTTEMWGSGALSEDAGTTNSNSRLLNGYLNARDGATDRTNVITLKGLTPSAQYSVIAYTLRDTSGAQAAYWINTNTESAFHILSEGRDFWWSDPQFRRGTNTQVDAQGFVPNDINSYGNYVRWDGVSPLADGSLRVSVASETNVDLSLERGPINGIQLISSSAFPTNDQTPMFVLQPRDVRVSLGQAGTFRATVDGPWTFQWYSNDVAIPGATSSAFTTLPIAGIEDTRVNYHLAASNGERSTTSSSVHLILVPALPPGGIFYDGFDYPEGPLGNWGEWNLDNIAVVDGPGLTYSDGTNSLAVSGNALVPPREAAGWITFKFIPVKSFGTTVYGGPNTTNYMSFLYDFRNLTADGGIGVSGFLGTGDWGNERFFVGKVYGRETIGFDSGPPQVLSEFTIYTNAFVVVRISQDDSTATFDMFVNPPLTGLPETPSVTTVAGQTVQFDAVGVNAGDWNRDDPNALGPFVDEFRFGQTYASVAPMAENRPVLSIVAVETDQVRISWSPATAGFTLEMSDSLISPSWTNAPAGNPVTIPITGQANFFRLKQ